MNPCSRMVARRRLAVAWLIPVRWLMSFRRRRGVCWVKTRRICRAFATLWFGLPAWAESLGFNAVSPFLFHSLKFNFIYCGCIIGAMGMVVKSQFDLAWGKNIVV